MHVIIRCVSVIASENPKPVVGKGRCVIASGAGWDPARLMGFVLKGYLSR